MVSGCVGQNLSSLKVQNRVTVLFLEMMRTQLHNNLESRKGFIWDYTESYEKQYSVSHKNMNIQHEKWPTEDWGNSPGF